MKATYDLFTGEELKIAEKIQQRRYQLLVHSCIYYHFNQTVIQDLKWDQWAQELRNLQSSYPEISKKVTLYEYFADWDASTGAFLPITLPWVIKIASQILQKGNSFQSVALVEKKKVAKRRLF